MANDSLNNAKKNKNDEFYTMIEDIEIELENYKTQLENKVIYCNCDNPEKSNFWKYFHLHFSELKLKKLIATFYSAECNSYCMEYSGGNDSGVKTELKYNGDFRSFECVKILKESDVIITNPPFSLFRQMIKLLITCNKKFLLIGNLNAVNYKEIFPLIKNDEIKISTNKPTQFSTPEGKMKKLSFCRWFSNLENVPKKEPLQLIEYNPENYKQYDNYPIAINVDRIKNIPDYNGLMGVPITFIDHYNPEQFQLIGHEHDVNGNCGKGVIGGQFEVNGERKFKRLLIKKKNN